jgi:hypothetical protein
MPKEFNFKMGEKNFEIEAGMGHNDQLVGYGEVWQVIGLANEAYPAD